MIDFGIARSFRPGQTRDTQLLGSPGYAAPEQYGRAQTTPQTDIYSLGALLHTLLSGQDPSEQRQELAPLRVDQRPELTVLTQRMLSVDPGARPANVREVAAELETMRLTHAAQDAKRIWLPPTPQPSAAGGQIQLQLPPSSQKVAPPPAKHRLNRRRVLIGLGVLTAAAVGGGIWWQNATADSPYTYRGHTDVVNAVAWSPDGKRLASGSDDRSVQVWDAHSGGNVTVHRDHTDGVTAVAWSPPPPDSTAIASASRDATVQISNGPEGDIVYRGHSAPVNAVGWSSYFTFLASGSDDKTVQVWHQGGEGLIFTYHGHTDAVSTVIWSPDGKRLASGSRDHTVQVWDIPHYSNR